MGGFSLTNYNPFILLSVLFGLLLLIRHLSLNQSLSPSIKFMGRLRFPCLRLGKPFHHFLIVSLLVNLVMVPMYTAYFVVYECSVSSRYHLETIELSRTVMHALEANNIDYWLDFATLLAGIRRQTVNQWDHDSDFSTIHPDYHALPINYPSFISSANNQSTIDEQYLAPLERARSGFQPSLDSEPSANIKQYMNAMSSTGMFVEWIAHRNLLQIWPTSRKRGPHVDIWFWVPTRHEDGSLWLYTHDHTIHYWSRPADEILPLRPIEWLGTSTKAPNRLHHVSSKEYSAYGGSYMLVSVFPRDCFHNFFNLRWAY